MIRNLICFFGAIFLTTTIVGSAHAEEKIALVSLQRALNEVNEGKKAKASLKKDFDDKKKQLEALKTDLESQRSELEKKKDVLAKEALQTQAQGLQTKYVDLQNKEMTYINELKQKESDSAKRILEGLRGVVLKMAKDNGYTLIIENSADVVLFSQNAEDITDKVIAGYNATGGAK